MKQQINEIRRMQQLAGLLKENEIEKINPSDIEENAKFEYYSSALKNRIRIKISRIEKDFNGESVYFQYIDRGNQGDYLMGDKEEAAELINKGSGIKIK
jgi:hypothetical protein